METLVHAEKPWKTKQNDVSLEIIECARLRKVVLELMSSVLNKRI